MYKIVELNEREITHFKGKIIQVIDSTKRDVVTSTNMMDCLGYPLTSRMWVLTCLVEVEERK